jgi:bacterioferritin-associated ferredoxin
MIVCICRAKNERDVLRAIEAGAETLTDLQACGIGTDCGGCHNSLRVMLRANENVPAIFAPMPVAAACSENAA